MADSNIGVTPGTGALVDTRTNPGGEHREVVVVGDPTTDSVAKVGTGGEQWASITSPAMSPFGVFARITPFAALRVTGEPTTLFWDVFDSATIDTTKWGTGGTVLPNVTGGAMSIAPGTTLSAWSSLYSQPAFGANGTGYNAFASVVTLESAAVAGNNQYRFWGQGTGSGGGYNTPTSDGVGFEVDGNGVLSCVAFIGGVKYVINSTSASQISSSVPGAGGSGTAVPAGASVSNLGSLLTWQGGSHRFGMHVRADSVFWYIEGQDKPVAIANYLMPNTQTLPVKVLAFNNSSGTVSNALTFLLNSVAIADTTAGNGTISDASYPWRKAQVGKSGGLSVRGASIPGTSNSFGATVTGTVGPLDVSEAGNITITAKNQTLGSPWTGTPVLVFEQSDDNTNWAPMPVQRMDTGSVASTQILPAGTNLLEFVFNAPLQGINYVRVRVTTGTTANGITVSLNPGGGYFMPFVSLAPPSRTPVSYFMALPVQASATDTLLSLTGYRGGAAVAATTTPAVVPAGKTFRVTGFNLGYIATITGGYAIARLRHNPSGVVAIGSPVARVIMAGSVAATSANATGFSATAPFDGLEFPAGSGIGVSLVGMSAVTPSAVGYGFVELVGYEY